MACVASTFAFQPEMVPSSVAKMKLAVLPVATAKAPLAAALFCTCPVGLPAAPDPLAAPAGMMTLSACGTPVLLYKVERPAPWSDTQKGLAADSLMPQASIRFGSVW